MGQNYGQRSATWAPQSFAGVRLAVVLPSSDCCEVIVLSRLLHQRLPHRCPRDSLHTRHPT